MGSTLAAHAVAARVVESARMISRAAHDYMHAQHQRRGGLLDDRHGPLCLSNCGDVSDTLGELFGWEVVDGRYGGPMPGGHYDRSHSWCVLPDGTIVDATADQYGDSDPVRVLPVGDARREWYEAA